MSQDANSKKNPVPVSVSGKVTGSEKTEDELVEIATQVYNSIFKRAVEAKGKSKLVQELVNATNVHYPDFAQSFPLVVRDMAATGIFDTAVFRRFLAYYKSKVAPNASKASLFKTAADFNAVHAHYLLFVEEARGSVETDAKKKKFLQEILKKLDAEDSLFNLAKKQSKEELKQVEKDLLVKLKSNLAALAKKGPTGARLIRMDVCAADGQQLSSILRKEGEGAKPLL